MVTDNITAFRERALGAAPEDKLHLTSRPYTWPELQGLLMTARTLREINFPRSQLYRLRQRLISASQRGAVVASVMDYLYARTQGLRPEHSAALAKVFDLAWHRPMKEVAPWRAWRAEVRTEEPTPEQERPYRSGHETIWLDLVEIYDFVAPRGGHLPVPTIEPTTVA